MGKMSVQLDISTKNLVLYEKISNYHEFIQNEIQTEKLTTQVKKLKVKINLQKQVIQWVFKREV